MSLERSGQETKSSPHKTYIRRCELNPQTSEEIADLFSKVVQTPSFKEPLAQFLNNINSVPPGLVGIGLAFWCQDSVTAIAPYLVIDEGLAQPQAGELSRETGQIHSNFANQIRSINISSGAWYSRWPEASFDEAMEKILEELYELPEDPEAVGAPDFFIAAKKQSLQTNSL